ncbi:ATP-dependent helicase [Ferrimicrobium sp.]|uniref:ATP-dependent helicase n=1 Tax=Ferrimicrobium sp. TaxID=2926050 RepID=UPI00263A0960|nr:UvrD-helicase domain-containing protein [Ferrimicrobium sp.]
MPNPAQLLEGLSSEQREAVMAAAPVLIVAGAGSGKTRVITHRIAYQIATQANRSTQTVAISFTRAAAWEVSRRLYRLLDGPPPACGTFHSHALGLVREGSAMLGRPLPHLIGDTTTLLADLGLRLPEARRRGVMAEIERLRALGHDAEGLQRNPTIIAVPNPDELIAIFVALERAKARQRLMDLTDVLRIATELVTRDDGVGEALRLQARWVYIDEFQDVNPLQLRFIERWMGNNLSGLTVVGDPNQAIYGWNGSDPALMTQLSSHIPTLTHLTLSTNYRSTAALVAAASPVASDDRRISMRAQRQGGQLPSLFGTDSVAAEGLRAARAVVELAHRDIPYSSMAILARTIRQLSPIEEAFRRFDIPHSVLGLTPLASAPEVIALMRSARTERLQITEICDTVEEALLSSTPTRTPNLRILLEVANELRRQDPRSDYLALEELLRGLQIKGVDAVSITTFHRAKGLQWYHVHLVGIGEKSYPSRHGLSSSALAEERRLLYVAMTRATDSLTISWSKPSRGPSTLLAHLDSAEVKPHTRIPHSQAHPSIATRLDRWRVTVAKERQLASYLVLSDADVRRLARLRPSDRESVAALVSTPLVRESPELIDRLWGEFLRVP